MISTLNEELQTALLEKGLKERTDLYLLTLPSNPRAVVNRTIAISLSKESFKYFCNNFVWIQNPRATTPEDKEIPFLLYEYQEEAAAEVIKAITDGHDLPIEKSRDMGMSWLLIAIFVWGWHFHQWDFLVGSQKAENVDTRGNIKALLEKARYIISRLPTWMMPTFEQGYHDKNMVLVHPEHKATIAGESNNANFGRSDRRKAILFDEFSSWELTDRAAWQSCSATTQCRIPLSTPNRKGTNCWFYQIIADAKKRGKPYLRLHWTLHPTFAKGLYYDDYKRPHSPWYDSENLRASSRDEVAQELDIDYEASMAGRVFGEFDLQHNVDETLRYNPDLPLYIAWDFGLDQTALLWIQYDPWKRLHYIVDEYINDGKGEGDNIYHYIDVIYSKDYKKALHFGDPQSGENRSITSGQSPAQILRKHGIIFRSQRTRIVNRVNAGRNIISRLRVAPNCTLAIEMFTSWQMRKPQTGNTSSELPEHSSYSHLGEAYTYYAFNFNQKQSKEKELRHKNYAPNASGVMI